MWYYRIIPALKLLKKLKTNADLRDIPVQILSCCDRDPAALALGAVEFRTKPLNADQIMAALTEMEKQPHYCSGRIAIEDDRQRRPAPE